MKKQTRMILRMITGILMIGVMMLIFSFSAQNGEESAGLSGNIVEWIQNVLVRPMNLPQVMQEFLDNNLGFIIRKLAHFSIYTALGFSSFGFFATFEKLAGKKAKIIALIWSAAYAMTDEFHQLFTGGRSGQITDVLLDSCGVLFRNYHTLGNLDYVSKKKTKNRREKLLDQTNLATFFRSGNKQARLFIYLEQEKMRRCFCKCLQYHLQDYYSSCKQGFLPFGYISGNQLFPEPLSQEEEQEYLRRYTLGDKEAKNILIERNLRLVAHISKKYTSNPSDQDDLISIGTIGLIKGIQSFDANKGVKLATYVSRCIDNEILMFLRASKKKANEVYLEEPIGKDKDDNVVTLQEVLENQEKNIEEVVDLKLKTKKLYKKMDQCLKPREKEIIYLRFGLDGTKPKTQNQIAKMMGISRSYVSRIETKAIHKLSKEMEEEIE